MAEYANPNALVETDWLDEHLDDEKIRVIEVDEEITAYEKGHIRGAVGWNWTSDLHTKVGRDYVSRPELSDLLSRAG
ncbi:MAG: sulfurtransferase, partial [Actinomycetota bacterium]